MCLSCGCGTPNDNHGDERHITKDTLQAAADAAGIDPTKAARNISGGLTGGDWKQTSNQQATWQTNTPSGGYQQGGGTGYQQAGAVGNESGGYQQAGGTSYQPNTETPDYDQPGGTTY